MNCLLITVTLFLLGVSSSLGHSIAKIELRNASAVDVYEIKEDNATNSIAFVNPKPMKPTLREIVFYHIVERPYDEDNTESVENEVDGPGFDRRPFTNSHGFPFLEPVIPIETKDERENENSDEYDEEGEYYYEEVPINPESRKTPPVMPMEDEEKEDAYETPEIIVTEAGELQPPSTTTTEKPEIYVTAASNVEPSTTTEINEASSTEKPVSDKAKRTRKLLFDLVKEKYSIKNNNEQSSTPQPEVSTNSTSAPAERRKRAVRSTHIPEAPELGKLSTDDLPPYLRSLIPNEKPQRRSAKYESDEDAGMEKIKNKMKGLMDNLKSKNSEENSLEESEEDHAPRTYGMNLTPEGGYVWNDMWSDPGVYYSVEEPESVMEKIEEIMEEAEKESAPDKDYNNKGDNKNKEEDTKDKEPKDPKPKDNKEDFDIEVKVDRPRHNKKKPVDHNNNEHDKKSKDNAHKENPKDDKNHENENKNDLKASKNEVHKDGANKGKAYGKAPEDKKPEEHDDGESDQVGFRSKSVISADDDSDDDSFEDKSRKRNKKGHKEENLVDELIENEQFWSWLADWTAVYMDVLTEHIKDQIQEEVSKQMQLFAEDYKTEYAEEESDKPNTDDESYEDLLATNDEQDSEENDNKNQNEDMSTNDNIELNSTNEENNIDATTNSSKSEKESPAKVEAHNLYGNSIGSDQVTNIFIFYPNKESDSVIEDLKSSNMSVPGLQVFGSLNDKNNEPVKENEKQDDSSERKKDNTEKPIEEKKMEENSKPNDSSESKKEMVSKEEAPENENIPKNTSIEDKNDKETSKSDENSESKDNIVKNSDTEEKNDSNVLKEDNENDNSQEESKDGKSPKDEKANSSPKEGEDENLPKTQNEGTEKLDSNSEDNGIKSKSD